MAIRFVRVEKNAATNGIWHMHFAELEAYNTSNVNVALNKPSSASSEAYGGLKERANDGNTSGIYSNGSVWHSLNDSNGSWWEVDLESEVELSKVKIYNRTDIDQNHVYPSYLDGVEIKLMSSNRTVEHTFTFNYNWGDQNDPLNAIQEFNISLPTLVLSSINMEDIINPNTTGTVTITFNRSLGEANLNAYVSINPAYIGTIGDITSVDGGVTYTGIITRSADMNRLGNKVEFSYNGLTGTSEFKVLDDESLVSVLISEDVQIDGSTNYFHSGTSLDVSTDGKTVIFSSRFYNSDQGSVRVMEKIGENWVQKGQYLYGLATGVMFGEKVSISGDGNIIAVSAQREDVGGTNTGQVKVYEYDGTNWVQKGSSINGEYSNDESGMSLYLSRDGSIVAIGAQNNDDVAENSGHVRVFEFNGTNWIQKGNDIDGVYANSLFAQSISMSNNNLKIALGLKWMNNAVGQVRVFEYNGTNWVQYGGNIDGVVGGNGEQFGSSISMSSDGSRVAIGAPETNNPNIGTGRVCIYEFNGTTWNQLGSTIRGTNQYAYFGGSVSISDAGDKLLAGGKYQGVGGEVKLYIYDGSDWVQEGVTLVVTNANEQFGSTTAISGDGKTIVASAPNGNNNFGYIKVYNTIETIERTIISMNMSDTLIKFPETGATFEIKYSTNDKTIGDVQGGLTLDPITAGSLTNVTMGNNGFSLVGTYNAATQTETTGNKLKYVEGVLSAEVEFILSTAEKAISNICFYGDAKVLTSEGYVEIKNIKRGMKVQGEEVEEVTRSISKEEEVVKMKKWSIMKGMPKEDTIITKEHKVLYKGQMIEAKKLVNGETIVYEKYKGETLYNILLSGEGKMVVNGMIVETLSPSNNIAKLYKIMKGYKEEEKREIIKIYNEERKRNIKW